MMEGGSLAALAPPDLFGALRGGGGMVARAAAMIDAVPGLGWVKPGPSVWRYHEVDVAVVGDNAVIGCLVAAAAARRNLATATFLRASAGGWPDGLLSDPAFAVFLDEAVRRFLTHDVAASPASSGTAGAIGEVAARGIVRPVGDVRPVLGRSAGGRAVLFGERASAVATESDGFLRAMLSSAMSGVRRVDMRPDGLRRRALVARRIVLVSAADGFCDTAGMSDEAGTEFMAAHPEVRLLGSARRGSAHAADGVHAAMRDVMDAASGAVLSGLAAPV